MNRARITLFPNTLLIDEEDSMNRMSVIIGFLVATFIMSGCITHSTDKSCDDFTYIQALSEFVWVIE